MDDQGLERRLESLTPPDLEGARQRAKLAARVSLAEGRVAAGAGGRRRRTRRDLGFATALAAVVAAVVVSSVGGGGSAVRPEVASAAELTELGESMPRFQLVKFWQVVDTESDAEGGVIRYAYEGPAGLRGIPADGQAELLWHSATLGERGAELEAEGFTLSGPKPMMVARPNADLENLVQKGTAQVYVADEAADGSFEAAGLWEEEGRTLEFRATVPDFDTLERLMERLNLINEEQWLIALQPGGGHWLTTTDFGGVTKVERTKVGEKPNGEPIYSTTTWVGEPRTGASLKEFVEKGFPTIIREDGTVRTVIRHGAPGELEEGEEGEEAN